MNDVIRAIAIINGVSEEEVMSEMEYAISYAISNGGQNACDIWNQIPCMGDTPSPQETITFLADFVKTKTN